MTIIKMMMLALVALSTTAQAQTKTPAEPHALAQQLIPESLLKFEFYPQDGSYFLKCTHTPNKVLPGDWDLVCGEKGALWGEWKFRAHVLIRKFTRSDQSTHYEVLYWVVDKQLSGVNVGKYTGTSMWLRFDKDSPVREFQVSQEVQGLYFLDMKFRPKGFSKKSLN